MTKNWATSICFDCIVECKRHRVEKRRIIDVRCDYVITYSVYYCRRCKTYFNDTGIGFGRSKYSCEVQYRAKALIAWYRLDYRLLSLVQRDMKEETGLTIPISTLSDWGAGNTGG